MLIGTPLVNFHNGSGRRTELGYTGLMIYYLDSTKLMCQLGVEIKENTAIVLPSTSMAEKINVGLFQRSHL